MLTTVNRHQIREDGEVRISHLTQVVYNSDSQLTEVTGSMRRRTIGAILLPLPFAALPVVVVLVGALFGPGESEELVTQNLPAPVTIEDSVATTDRWLDDSVSLASVSSPVEFEPDCGEYDLSGT